MHYTHIRLQYKETERSRVWKNSSLTMWKEGYDNMVKSAKALQKENGWHDWQIIYFNP